MTATTVQVPVRLDFDAHAPAFAKALAHLDNAATRQLDQVDFDHRLRELVRIRASQLNGCAYCIDMHTKDARAAGETEQRIYALPAWRETPFFTARERAALGIHRVGDAAGPGLTCRPRRTPRWPPSTRRTRSPRWSASWSRSTPGTRSGVSTRTWVPGTYEL